MVKRAGFLALFLPVIMQAGFFGTDEEWQERRKNELKASLENEFDKLNKINEARQVEVFEMIQFPQKVIEGQIDKKNDLDKGRIAKKYFEKMDEEDRNKLLGELFLKYSEDPNARQKFIDDLITSPTNSEYLLNPDVCQDVGREVNPYYMGVIPVVEWLNTAHLPTYFRPTMTDILVNKAALNEFNSFNQWGLWLEPYGFNTQFRRKHPDLRFDLFTIGVSVGGEMTLYERLILGLGATYSHSVLDWEQKKDDLRLNSVYVGPYLGYLFSSGYLSLTLMGVGNFYDITRGVQLSAKTPRSQNIINQTSWDLLARLEGGFSYSPGGNIYFSPLAKVDYLHVFEQGCVETLVGDEDSVDLTINSMNTPFLSSKIGLKLSREWYNESYGYVIPNLSGGWLNFSPITDREYHYKIEECKSQAKVTNEGWSQYYLGVGFTFVHKKGILISLDYELTLGANSPVQEGSIRAELSW